MPNKSFEVSGFTIAVSIIITFDLQGNVIKNDAILDESFLDIDNLPKQTIHFIEENRKYWNTHKVNK